MEIVLNVWKLQQYFGVALVGLLIMMAVRKRIGNVALAAWAWAFLSAAGIAFAPWIMQEWIPEAWRAELALRTNYSSAQATFMVLAIPMASFVTPKPFMWNMLRVFFLAESFLLPIGWSTVNGASFSSAILICSLPLFLQSWWVLAVPWVLGIALWYQGATTIACLAALIVASLWVEFPRKRWWLIPAAGAGVMTLGALIQGGQLADSSGRFTMWTDYTAVWARHLPVFNGIGLGAWEWFGPYVKNGTNIHYYAVHNDYLQLMFETGVVGVGLFLAVVGMTLWRVRKSQVWFSMGCALAVCAFFYYPMHYAATQLLALQVFLYGVDSSNRSKIRLSSDS